MANKRANFNADTKWQVQDLFKTEELYNQEYQKLTQDLLKYAD